MQKKENPPRLFSNLVKFAFVFCWKIYSCDALFLRILSDSELKECKILRGHHIAWERSVFRKAVYMLQACECECVCVYCAVTSSVKTSKGGVHSVRRYSWGVRCLWLFSAWTKTSSVIRRSLRSARRPKWHQLIHARPRMQRQRGFKQHQTTCMLQTSPLHTAEPSTLYHTCELLMQNNQRFSG